MWDLVLKLGGQLRVVAGMKTHTLGFDYQSAFALARALRYDTLALGELLPEIEAIMVREMSKAGGGS